MTKMMTVPEETLKVLEQSTVDGTIVRLPDIRLDRKQYESVNKVLEAIGGTWDKRAKGHVFADDPAALLDDVLATATVAKPNSLEFFPTPPDLAARVMTLAGLQPGLTVLEPSAGAGALASLAGDLVGPGNVTCIEVQERFHEGLHQLAGDVMIQDFLTVTPPALEDGFDRVVMNPPFSRFQDIQHVLHAWEFLKSRGRLVTIMSAGVTFRTDQRSVAFRALVDRYGAVTHNPANSFAASGTNVNTVTVVLNKPSMARQIADSLEDAIVVAETEREEAA